MKKWRLRFLIILVLGLINYHVCFDSWDDLARFFIIGFIALMAGLLWAIIDDNESMRLSQLKFDELEKSLQEQRNKIAESIKEPHENYNRK